MSDACMSCGRETGPGTPTYSGRKRARDTVSGMEGFLCDVCQESSGRVVSDQSIPLSGRYVVIDLPGGLPGGTAVG
jgi:hypothetical protein